MTTIDFQGKLYSVDEFAEEIGLTASTVVLKLAEGQTPEMINAKTSRRNNILTLRGKEITMASMADFCKVTKAAVNGHKKDGLTGDEIYDRYSTMNGLPPAEDMLDQIPPRHAKPKAAVPAPYRALVGFAIGDAMGKPFETQEMNSPGLQAWERNPIYLAATYEGLGDEGKLPGRFTDDTQMVLCLAEGCRLSTERSGFHQTLSGRGSPVAAAELARTMYIQWFQRWPKGCVVPGVYDGPRGIGSTVAKALEEHKGVLIEQANCYVGNGALMRVLPLGMFYRNNPKAMREAIMIDTANTHTSPEAVAGSIAYATVVAHLITSGMNGCLAKALDALEECELDYTVIYESVRHVRTALNSDRSELTRDHAAMAKKAADIGNSGYVAETLASSLFLGLRSESPRSGIISSVMAGGDTDTRTALTGALLALRFDVREFPQHWISGLECVEIIQDVNHWLLDHPYAAEIEA